MTKEQLLVPRWKCIANYPGNTFYIGEIFEIPLDCKLQQIVLEGNDYSSVDLDIDPNFYPAIFEKLEWWEDRQLENMPEYVKYIGTTTYFWIKPNQIVKSNWKKVKSKFKMCEISCHDFIPNVWEPSTEEEYLKQNNG